MPDFHTQPLLRYVNISITFFVLNSFSKYLNEFNIYVQAINFPTVAVGTERLRFAPTPYHDDGMIEDLVSALKTIFKDSR